MFTFLSELLSVIARFANDNAYVIFFILWSIFACILIARQDVDRIRAEWRAVKPEWFENEKENH